MMGDPFTQALRSEDLMEKLAANPETRKHLADQGFLEQLKKLQAMATDPAIDFSDWNKASEVSQKVARTAANDPRLMQALMVLQGFGLTVDESDYKKAETMGDMPRREPVQLEHLQLVQGITSADEAKAKGNEFFKKGKLSEALAHYDRGVELLRNEEEAPAAAIATLLSNASLCLLKLKWPDRAKKNASKAIALIRAAEDDSFDQSKLFYRRAMASEQLKEFDLAVDDMLRACQQAHRAGLDPAEQQRLRKEVERLKKLKTSKEEDKSKKKQEQENEKIAEVQRVQGAQLSEKAKKNDVPAGNSTVDNTVPDAPGGGSYIKEQDFSHWTLRKVSEAVQRLKHKGSSGCTLETVRLDEDQSKIQASITMKKGKRALYYEMDLHISWSGKAASQLKPADGTAELQGVIRVYNIAHDTKFELGGDANTSYIYSLGWDHRLSGPWVEDIRTEAAELFDLVAAKVDAVIEELRKK